MMKAEELKENIINDYGLIELGDQGDDIRESLRKALDKFIKLYGSEQKKVEFHNDIQLENKPDIHTIEGLDDLFHCVRCFIRTEQLSRKWDNFREEWLKSHPVDKPKPYNDVQLDYQNPNK